LYLHFYLNYLLLNSCDRNDAKQRVFLGRLLKLLVALKRAGCVVLVLKREGFSLADIQTDVLLPHARTQALFPLTTASSMRFCDIMLAHVLMRRCFKSRTAAGIADRCLCNVHTFLHQSTNSVVNRTVWWTQIWRY